MNPQEIKDKLYSVWLHAKDFGNCSMIIDNINCHFEQERINLSKKEESEVIKDS